MRLKNTAVRQAVSPVIEFLEERRLLSATLTLVNPSNLPASNRLIFNTIENLNPTFPNVVHDTNVLELKNTGDAALTIGALTLSGPWSITAQSAGYSGLTNLTIPAGQEDDITLTFTQTTLPAHSVNQTNYTTNPNGGAAIFGSLTISNTNDPVTPNQTVTLAGYWQSASESNAEPNLTTITNLLAGYDTVISNPYSVDLTESGTTPTYYGQEVVSNSWVAANPSEPITLQQLAGFHTEGNVVHTYWYSASTDASHLLMTSVADEGQSLLPTFANGQLMTASFTPGGAFGFRVDDEYSSDALNIAAGNKGGAGHHFRFYPLINSSGQVVPDTWLVAMDYAIIQTENFDFNDNVFIVSNMAPTSVPPAPTNLTATNAVHPVLNWTGVTYSNLAGYNVYSSTLPTGPFTKLTPSPIAQTTFTDPNTEPGSQTVYYRVTAVDATTSDESAPATTSANTPAGPVAVNTSFDADAGIATPLNVLQNDTVPTGATINPTTVVINAAPTHGTATVDPVTGVVTYTATVGYSGTDTFTYHFSDSQPLASNVATVTINVSNVAAAAPVAANLSLNTLVGVALTTITPTATDIADNALPVTAVTLVTQPAHGVAVLNAGGTTITYTPTSNFVGTDSFTYTLVGNANNLVSNTATATLNVGVEIGSAKGANKSINYTDGTSGVAATITISKGTADAYFNGSATDVTVKGKITLTGAHLSISNIIASGTTTASVLTIATLHNAGSATFDAVNDTGTLGSIVAKSGILDGVIETPTITVGGLSSITLKSASNADLEIGSGAPKGLTFAGGTITDSFIHSAVGVKSIKVAAWSDTDNANLTINATAIGSLTSAGNFDPNLELSGSGSTAPTLGPTKVAGQLNTGFWNITGNVSSVTANAVTSSWGADIVGTLGSFTIKSGGLPADLAATTINSLNITGNLTANVTATTAKNIKVSGNVSGSTIYITGDLTSLTAASLVGSLLDVGTSTSTVDVTNAVIANIGTSTIGNVTLTSKLANAFSDSSIVAALIKSQSLGAVDTSNGGVKEGVAGTFKSFTANFGGVVLHAGAPQLINATTFSNYWASKGLTASSFGDFEVDFIS